MRPRAGAAVGVIEEVWRSGATAEGVPYDTLGELTDVQVHGTQVTAHLRLDEDDRRAAMTLADLVRAGDTAVACYR